MTKKQKQPRYTVKDYMAELIDYGGEIMPRSEVIADMQSLGWDQQSIGLWFCGYEHAERMRLQREKAHAA